MTLFFSLHLTWTFRSLILQSLIDRHCNLHGRYFRTSKSTTVLCPPFTRHSVTVPKTYYSVSPHIHHSPVTYRKRSFLLRIVFLIHRVSIYTVTPRSLVSETELQEYNPHTFTLVFSSTFTSSSYLSSTVLFYTLFYSPFLHPLLLSFPLSLPLPLAPTSYSKTIFFNNPVKSSFTNYDNFLVKST